MNQFLCSCLITQNTNRASHYYSIKVLQALTHTHTYTHTLTHTHTHTHTLTHTYMQARILIRASNKIFCSELYILARITYLLFSLAYTVADVVCYCTDIGICIAVIEYTCLRKER